MWDKQTIAHFQNHLTSWPASGKEIIEACNNMSDVPEHDKRLIEGNLDPHKTYQNLDEVMTSLDKIKVRSG